MSKEVENPFFNNFSRVALMLSTVTSSFLLANTGVVEGVNAGGTELRDNENNVSINQAIKGGASVVEINTTISGSIVAGEFSSYTDSEGNYHYDYNSSHNSIGTAVGLDINATGITTVTNLGSIGASVETLADYATGADTVAYPDQNNTDLTALALRVANEINQLENNGTISAVATLNNDTNNSLGRAVGVAVSADISEGIVNNGSISATAIKTDADTTHTRTTQATIGGATGTSGDLTQEYTTGDTTSTITRTTRPVGIFAREEEEIRSSSEAGITVTEHDFKEVDSLVVDYDSNNVVEDTISASGIAVGATITGGIVDHGYISSIDLNASGVVQGGDDVGSKNGITITPNDLATGGEILTEASASGDTDTDADALVASYEENLTNYETAIDTWIDEHNMTDFFRNDDANTTQDTSDSMAQFYNNRDFSQDINATAVENYITDDEDTIGAGPSPDENFDDHVDDERPVKPDTTSATVTEAEVSPTVAASIDSGSHEARVGNIYNAGEIKGVDGGNGIEVRATSGSNAHDLLNDVNDSLDANLTNNAYVTSGTVSAYIGEGSSGRVVTQDATGNVSNTLIGGILNDNLIQGADAKAGILLESDSSIALNSDENNTDNLSFSTTRNSAGDIVPIVINPSSTVAVGRIQNSAGATIKGGDAGYGIDMQAQGDVSIASNNDGNITGGRLIVSPSSLNTVKEIINYGTIQGGDGGAGIRMEASGEASIVADAGNITNANIAVTPLVTNRIDLLVNSDTIKGGMGGYGIKGDSVASASVTANDINHSDLSIASIVNSTIGDLYNVGEITVSLAKDAIKLTSEGSAELVTDAVNDSIINLNAQSTGGVRIKGNSSSDGNFVNGGTISASLASNAINMDATGNVNVDTAESGAGKETTTITNSQVTIQDHTIAGTEGNFVNIATTIDENRTKTVQRGTISASLSADAMTQEATGSTILESKNITNSTVTLAETTIAGIGGDFDNGGVIKTALSANAIDLSSTATTTAHDKENSEINGSVVSTSTSTRAGVGGDFINGAYALESGEEKNGTTLVNNPSTGTSNYLGGIVAAEINDANDSIRISIGAHENNVTVATDTLQDSDPIFYHNREDEITTASISASLSADAVKFESNAKDTLAALSIEATTTTRVNSGETEAFETMSQRSVVSSSSESNSSIGGNFINNGSIKVALSGTAINGASSAEGTLCDATMSDVITSTVTQTSTSIAGVAGDFENRVVSSNIGEGSLTTELSGSTEVPTVYYDRATNTGEVAIKASLSADAVNVSSDATNTVTLHAVNKDEIAVVDSQSHTDNLTAGTATADALNTRSNITSTTTSIAGIGGDFTNTGTIKVALSANGIDATATGSNTVGTATDAGLFGSTITSNMRSVAGVRGDFINGVESLDTGEATLLPMDVKDLDGDPIYYVSGDPREGERVKSNVLDSNARVIGQDGHEIDTNGIVYNQELIKGEIKASLSATAIKLDAQANSVIEPTKIGMSSVEHITLNDNNESIFDSNRTIKVASVLNVNSTSVSGVGGRFTNRNLISTSLSKEAISAIATADTKFGNGLTTVDGLDANITTVSIAGIGYANEESRGFINAANSYDTGAVQLETSQIKVNNDSSTVIAANANDDNPDGGDLNLIDSETIAFWNKEIVVGTISSSLAKEAIAVSASANSVINPSDLKSATTTVNLIDGTTTDVENYLVAGTARTQIDQNTQAYAGINGGFTNQGAITSSLAKEVLNAQATATGNVGGAGDMTITGANIDSTTKVVAGIQNGGFKNEVLSLDVSNGQVLTALDGTTEEAKLIFDKDTTIGQVMMTASLAKDVLQLDATATNDIKTAGINAADAVVASTNEQADVLAARSVVTNRTEAYGGIGGSFYNNALMSASLSKNVITSIATSDNNLGDGENIKGSVVTATALADTRIKGSFVNDTHLLDTGAPTINYRVAADGNLSNVVESITYEQEITQGVIKASLSKDVLNLTANGTNNITLENVDYDTIKRVNLANTTTGQSLDTTGAKSFSEANVSSSITATNDVKSGISGVFLNAGEMSTSLSGSVLNLQAIGGASTVEIDSISGGDVTASNNVLSGINIDGEAGGIAFLNDERDFNTVLETDENYDPNKVVTGTIKSSLSKNAINLVADGGAKTVVNSSSDMFTNNDTGYDVATLNNSGDNQVIINGAFVNRGEIIASTSPVALNLEANNAVHNEITSATVANSGYISSTVSANVATRIDGNLTNTGTIKTATGTAAIQMISNGGLSDLVGTIGDLNATKDAASNGTVIASNHSTTTSSIGALNNIKGTIEGADGAKAIVLTASGAVESDTLDISALNENNTGSKVVVNTLTSTASIDGIYNSGTIKTADAIVIDVSATGSAKLAAENAIEGSFESTSATVTASIGDIVNDAYTVQNVLRDVHKNFNTDHNNSTDDQLHPLESVVIANRGEYDFASFEATDSDAQETLGAGVTENDTYNFSTGTKIDTDSSSYSSEEELTALAYEDNNSSSNPILSQTVGEIKTADGAAAISLVATATDSNATIVKALAGDITNRGIISGGTGKGILLSSDGASVTGDKTGGAQAFATAGNIDNLVTHNEFTVNGETLHTVLTGSIKGEAGAIVLSAVGAADENVSTTTVNRIVNARTVLSAGSHVIGTIGDEEVDNISDTGTVIANGDDFETVTSREDNYGVKTLTIDGVYNAVIGSGADYVSINVGENAHVTDAIYNFGELDGKVKIGDADLYLYGLVQNSDKNVTYGRMDYMDGITTTNFFAQDEGKTAYITATDHTQEAGMINSSDDTFVSNAIVGSNIHFVNSHVLSTTDGIWEADHITIDKSSIVNIDQDTIFKTNTATNPFGDEAVNMFTNQGYLNVRAGVKATVDGNYEQDGGFYVANVETSSITAGSQDNQFDGTGDGGNFSQLNVTGNADLSGGILVMMDDVGEDGYAGTDLYTATQNAGTETRLVDIVSAGSLSVGDTNLTHGGHSGAAESTDADLLADVKVQDNSRVYDFEAVKGTTDGGVSLRIAAQDPNAAPINIDTSVVAVSAIANVVDAVSNRIDTRPTYTITTTTVTPSEPTPSISTSDDAPTITPTPEAEVTLTTTPTGTTPAGASTTGYTPTSTQPTGGTLEPRVAELAVLSQGTQATINGEVTLNTSSSVRPSSSDYEISKQALTKVDGNEELHAWGKIFASRAKQDGDNPSSSSDVTEKTTQMQVGRTGYTANTYGLIAGFDKQYDDWFVGTAFALAKSSASTDGGPSTDTDTVMYQVTEYGSHPMGDGRVNLQAGVAYLTNDKDRTDGYVGDGLGSDGKVYNSDYDGYALNAAIEYEQGVELNKETTLYPYASLSGTYVYNDGYVESGEGTNAQEVSDADSKALIIGLGTRANYKLSDRATLTGNVGIGYDMIAERVDYEARTALNPNSDTVHIEGAKPEELEYEMGVGYQYVTPDNTVIKTSVDHTARDGYSDTSGSIKFYFPF